MKSLPDKDVKLIDTLRESADRSTQRAHDIAQIARSQREEAEREHAARLIRAAQAVVTYAQAIDAGKTAEDAYSDARKAAIAEGAAEHAPRNKGASAEDYAQHAAVSYRQLVEAGQAAPPRRSTDRRRKT